MTNTEGFAGRAGNPDPVANYPLSDRLPPVAGVSSGDPLTAAGLSVGDESPWRAGAPVSSAPPAPTAAGPLGSWPEPPVATGNWSPPTSPGDDALVDG